MYTDFTQMPVWQKASEAMKEAYRIASLLPKTENYAMGQQIRDAALSIPGNIAEGFGRFHVKDKINFYYYSRGSAFEVRNHALCAVMVGYFSADKIVFLEQKCNEVIQDLNKLIRHLGG